MLLSLPANAIGPSSSRAILPFVTAHLFTTSLHAIGPRRCRSSSAGWPSTTYSQLFTALIRACKPPRN